MTRCFPAALAVILLMFRGVPAGAGTFIFGPLEAETPEGWVAAHSKFEGEATVFYLVLDGPEYDGMFGPKVVIGFSAAVGDDGSAADLTMIERGFREQLSAAQIEKFGGGRGLIIKYRDDGRTDLEPVKLALYLFEGGTLQFMIFPPEGDPRFKNWTEAQRNEIRNVWQSLTSDDPAAGRLLKAARKDLPPEFFRWPAPPGPR